MEAKLHRRVQRYGWDLAVEAYDRHWVPVLRGCSEQCLELAAPRPGERVLDLASGTGVAAFLAGERVGVDGEVVGTDLSEKMVEAARRGAEGRGVANVRFERSDAEDLGYPDASFDVVLCVLGLMYPADPQRAIDEAYRVLQPGGRAAVCVWGRRDHCGWNAVFPIIDAQVNSDVCPLFFSLGAPGALRFAFEQAGFVEFEEERREKTLAWESDAEACQAIFPGGPVALAYSRFSDDQRVAVQRDYLASIARFRRNGGYDVPGEFLFARASKPAAASPQVRTLA